jgi:Domain of unknown function DUF11
VALRRTKMILIKSLAMLALVALLASCDITAKTANPDPVSVGGNLTFKIDVAFEALEPETIVVDKLTDSLQFVSASDGCVFSTADNTVECTVTNPSFLGAGMSSVTIVVTPTECGTFTNTAFIPDVTPSDEQWAVIEQIRAEQLSAEQLPLEQLPLEELVTAEALDEESVDFTVVGCGQEQPQQPQPQQPQPQQPQQSQQPQPQQPAGAAPVTQESDQESEAEEIDQSLEVS